jgi:hypothetical protein
VRAARQLHAALVHVLQVRVETSPSHSLVRLPLASFTEPPGA